MRVELLSRFPDKETYNRLRKLGLDDRELLKHSAFTFSIQGISRACSHQLVRHRMASYLQQSQRYVKLDRKSFVVPPKINSNRRAREVYLKHLGSIWNGYEKLLGLGIPVEDARFLLPNAAKTNIAMTIKADSMLNFFRLRCCLHAQWEIRKLANKMLEEVKKVAPRMFAKAGPWCKMEGVCPEKDVMCVFYSKYMRSNRERS